MDLWTFWPFQCAISVNHFQTVVRIYYRWKVEGRNFWPEGLPTRKNAACISLVKTADEVGRNVSNVKIRNHPGVLVKMCVRFRASMSSFSFLHEDVFFKLKLKTGKYAMKWLPVIYVTVLSESRYLFSHCRTRFQSMLGMV